MRAGLILNARLACRTELVSDHPGPAKHPLFSLGKIVESLQGTPMPFDVEFVMPDDGK